MDRGGGAGGVAYWQDLEGMEGCLEVVETVIDVVAWLPLSRLCSPVIPSSLNHLRTLSSEPHNDLLLRRYLGILHSQSGDPACNTRDPTLNVDPPYSLTVAAPSLPVLPGG